MLTVHTMLHYPINCNSLTDIIASTVVVVIMITDNEEDHDNNDNNNNKDDGDGPQLTPEQPKGSLGCRFNAAIFWKICDNRKS